MIVGKVVKSGLIFCKRQKTLIKKIVYPTILKFNHNLKLV